MAEEESTGAEQARVGLGSRAGCRTAGDETELDDSVRRLLALDAEAAAYGQSPVSVRYLILDLQRALRAMQVRWRPASTPPPAPAAPPPRSSTPSS